MSDYIAISMTTIVEDESAVPRITEVMGRAAAGLALEGYSVSITFTKGNDEDARTEEDPRGR